MDKKHYVLNFPIETKEAQRFWKSKHKCNKMKSIIAFSLDLDNANANLRRYGYTRAWRKRALLAFGKYVNKPSMAGIPFSELSEIWYKCMPYSGEAPLPPPKKGITFVCGEHVESDRAIYGWSEGHQGELVSSDNRFVSEVEVEVWNNDAEPDDLMITFKNFPTTSGKSEFSFQVEIPAIGYVSPVKTINASNHYPHGVVFNSEVEAVVNHFKNSVGKEITAIVKEVDTPPPTEADTWVVNFDGETYIEPKNKSNYSLYFKQIKANVCRKGYGTIFYFLRDGVKTSIGVDSNGLFTISGELIEGCRFEVNGVPISHGDVAPDINVDFTLGFVDSNSIKESTMFVIGANETGNDLFSGYIYNVRYYNSADTFFRIYTLYEQSKELPATISEVEEGASFIVGYKLAIKKTSTTPLWSNYKLHLETFENPTPLKIRIGKHESSEQYGYSSGTSGFGELIENTSILYNDFFMQYPNGNYYLHQYANHTQFTGTYIKATLPNGLSWEWGQQNNSFVIPAPKEIFDYFKANVGQEVTITFERLAYHVPDLQYVANEKLTNNSRVIITNDKPLDIFTYVSRDDLSKNIGLLGVSTTNYVRLLSGRFAPHGSFRVKVNDRDLADNLFPDDLVDNFVKISIYPSGNEAAFNNPIIGSRSTHEVSPHSINKLVIPFATSERASELFYFQQAEFEPDVNTWTGLNATKEASETLTFSGFEGWRVAEENSLLIPSDWDDDRDWDDDLPWGFLDQSKVEAWVEEKFK